MKRLFSLLLLLLALPALYAQTFITNGSITNDTTLTAAGNPYYVTNNVDIPGSVTLTLEAGVNIRLGINGRLHVVGDLIAHGTPGNMILIEDSAGTTPPSYGNLFLVGGEVQASHIRFLNIEWVRLEVVTPVTPGNIPPATLKHCEFKGLQAGISSSRDSLRVDSCIFENCITGISVQNYFPGQTAYITNCRFYQNTGIGITFRGRAIVSNCTFTENKTGIWSQNTGTHTRIFHSDFQHNETSIHLANSPRFNGQIDLADTFTVQDNIFLLDTSIQQNGNTIVIADSIETALFTFKDNVLCSDLDLFHIDGQPILDLSDNCYCGMDSNQVASKIQWFGPALLPPNYPLVIAAPFYTDCVPDWVYPGDTDYDQVADMRDLLPIGMYFNQTGPVRPGASTAWIGQPATDWGTAQINGKDIKHVDTNGDGNINADDTLAIQLNYGATHRSFKNGGGGAPLVLQPQNLMEQPMNGDTFILDLIWGNMDTALHNVYGLVTSIQYDTNQISDAWVQFPNSWLGDPATNLLAMYRHHAASGQIDLGMVRTDGMSASGFGRIGSIIVVIDDDIFKRQIPLQLNFTDVYAIDSSGAEVEVNPRANTVLVTTGSLEHLPQYTLSVFPNPVREGFVHVSLSGEIGNGQLSLHNMQGRVIHQQNLTATARRITIPLKGLPSGMYFIKTTLGTRSKTVKLMKQ